MGRRKKKKDEEGSLLLALVVAVLLLAPIALMAARFYFAGKVRQTQQRLAAGERCLDLSEDERLELRRKKTELQRARGLVRAAMQRGADANLAVNKDGSFSARSKLGKSIRAVLEKYVPLSEALAQEVHALEAAPEGRRREFSFHVRQQFACEWGLGAWLIVFVLAYGYSWIATPEPSAWGSALLAGLAALVAYGIAYFAHSGSALKLIQEPRC